MNQDFIFINGQKINSNNLDNFSESWQGDSAIIEFLRAWWDAGDSIPAYTSGSTGKPKKIKLLKKFARKSALATLDKLNLKKGDTALLSMPANFIAGRMMLVRSIVGQLNLLPITASSNPNIPDTAIDLAAFTPHQFQGIIGASGTGQYRNIKNILLGGSSVTDDLIEKLKDFPGRIYETFGMTETYSHIALRLCYPEKESHFQAIGSTYFSTIQERLVIHAPDIGIDILETNDIVDLHGTTQFKWLGRADNVINSGGIKIHPEIIETKLAKALKSTFFVTGKPDDIYGEKVVLIIEKTTSNLSRDQISESISRVLDNYEKPKSIILVDSMIRTKTGKINREATKTYYNI